MIFLNGRFLEAYIGVWKQLYMNVSKQLYMVVSKRLPMGVFKRLHMGVSKEKNRVFFLSKMGVSLASYICV